MNTTSVIRHTKSWGDLFVKRLPLHNEGQRIKQELRRLGMSSYDLWETGSAYLTQIVKPGEALLGVVYEVTEDGSTILLATAERVIFLEQKPLYITEDVIPYEEITGVSHSRFAEHLTTVLHTDANDYVIRTTSQGLAERFLRYVEHRILQEKSYLTHKDKGE